MNLQRRCLQTRNPKLPAMEEEWLKVVVHLELRCLGVGVWQAYATPVLARTGLLMHLQGQSPQTWYGRTPHCLAPLLARQGGLRKQGDACETRSARPCASACMATHPPSGPNTVCTLASCTPSLASSADLQRPGRGSMRRPMRPPNGVRQASSQCAVRCRSKQQVLRSLCVCLSVRAAHRTARPPLHTHVHRCPSRGRHTMALHWLK